VLPAFILGLAMSNHYVRHRKEQERLRVVAFTFLTPFFFLKGGMSVSTGALGANVGTLALLFAGKMVPKLDRTQFSLLIAVVVLSAIVPTVIAQRYYQPSAQDEAIRDAAEMAEAY
jgi:Kef-type K+ transport system membrane component KefB